MHFYLFLLQTVGVEFCVKTVIIPDTNYVVELYLFDCAGQDMYTELVAKYVCTSPNIILFCFLHKSYLLSPLLGSDSKRFIKRAK